MNDSFAFLISFEGRSWSVEEMDRLTDGYRQRMELHPPETTLIAWVGENHPRALALFSAAMKCGRWLHCSRSVDSKSLARLKSRHRILIFFEDGREELFGDEIEPLQSGCGLLLNSSGTEGAAKLCYIPLTMIRKNAKNAVQILGLNNRSSVQVWSSLEHTAGWNSLLIPACVSGVQVQLHRNFTPYLAIRLMGNTENSVFHFSPLQARLCVLARSWRNCSLSEKNNLCVIGSASIDIATIGEFCSRGLQVLRNYGLTEVGPYVLSCLTTDKSVDTENLRLAGMLAPGLEERLVPLPNHGFGLQLRGDIVFGGYWGEPARDSAQWFNTGDAFELTQDGLEKMYLGRAADCWEFNGHRDFSDRIERRLLESLPELVECRVDAPTAEKSLVVIACGRNVTFKKIAPLVRDAIGMRDLSVTVRSLVRLPRTYSGKILRVATK